MLTIRGVLAFDFADKVRAARGFTIMSNFLLLPLVIVGTYVVTTDHTKDKVIVAILLFVQGKRTLLRSVLLRSLILRVFLPTKVNVDMSRVVWESEAKQNIANSFDCNLRGEVRQI